MSSLLGMSSSHPQESQHRASLSDDNDGDGSEQKLSMGSAERNLLGKWTLRLLICVLKNNYMVRSYPTERKIEIFPATAPLVEMLCLLVLTQM